MNSRGIGAALARGVAREGAMVARVDMAEVAVEEVAASIGETGDRGAVPEEMRSLMLRGAALVVWAGMEILPSAELMRTRADENRTNVVAMTAQGQWSATRTPLGTGPRAGLDAILVEIPLALAWHKEMVPGTDVVRGRTPEHYAELARIDRGAGDQSP